MPFGILSAPEVYQKSIDKFFGVSCYLDNLCVWSNSLEQHFERLEEVFKRTREYGLKFNSGKYEFIKEEIDYLGHVFTENSIKVDQKKISAIKNMLIPNSKQELMRFLGMVTYLMKFIPDMSSKTAPLREFLENNTGWQWMPKHEEVVQDLKKALTSCPTLRCFSKSQNQSPYNVMPVKMVSELYCCKETNLLLAHQGVSLQQNKDMRKSKKRHWQ